MTILAGTTVPNPPPVPPRRLGTLGAQPARLLYTTAQIRPTDLRVGDVMRVDGHWREVLDVRGPGDDIDQIAHEYGEESDMARYARSRLDHTGEFWVLVRYLDEVNSTPDELADKVTTFLTWNLVTIQVPYASQEGTPS